MAMKEAHFNVTVPKGTNPVEPGPGTRQLLSVVGPVEGWGELVSFEMAVIRDGIRTFDISLYSLGAYCEKHGWQLKFQLWDKSVESVADAEYQVDARFHFR